MKKTYKVIRKYPTEQFGNMDFEARGLESRDDISKELEYFDAVAKEYMLKQELAKAKDDLPSISLRCGNEYFVYNQKEKKLYKKEKIEIPKQEGVEPNKDRPF